MYFTRGIKHILCPLVVYQNLHFYHPHTIPPWIFLSYSHIIHGVLLRQLSNNLPRDVPFNVSHEELSKKLESGDLTLIDVRELGEITTNGSIEGSIVIPLGNLQTALRCTQEEFMESYGVDKPGLGDEIIFMCNSGVRSKLAAEIAKTADYKIVREYAEGWSGWKERINLQ